MRPIRLLMEEHRVGEVHGAFVSLRRLMERVGVD
jgi:hypothetical protein